MALVSYLKKRDGRYYVRVPVPKDVQHHYPTASGKPKEEIVKALGTSDPAEAKRLLRPAIDAIMAEFDRHRAKAPLTSTEIELQLQEFVREQTEAAEAVRRSGQAPFRTGTDASEQSPDDPVDDALTDQMNHFWTAYQDGDLSQVAAHAEAIVQNMGADAPAGSPQFLELCRGLLLAQAEMFRVERERHRGNRLASVELPLNPALSDPVEPKRHVVGPIRAESPRGATGSQFLDVTERYIAARMRDVRAAWTNQTRDQNETTFRLFSLFLAGKPVALIDSRDLVDFREKVLNHLPVSYGKSKGDKTKQLSQIIADGADKPKLKEKTIKRHFSALSGFFAWAISTKEHPGPNPAAGHKFYAVKNKRDGRRPFKIEELNTLFSSPVYTGCHRYFRSQAGEEIIKDSLYWVPLVALFTGLRLEEICKLRPCDVSTRDDIPFLMIEEEFDEDEGIIRSVKETASIRELPLHPTLIAAGFLAFVEEARKADQPRVFSDLKPGGPDNKFAYGVTDKFTRYRRAIGITDSRATLHSMRHNFKDACRLAEIGEEVHDALTGHSHAGVGRSYGYGVPLSVKARAMAKIAYLGLKLDHLLNRK